MKIRNIALAIFFFSYQKIHLLWVLNGFPLSNHIEDLVEQSLLTRDLLTKINSPFWRQKQQITWCCNSLRHHTDETIDFSLRSLFFFFFAELWVMAVYVILAVVNCFWGESAVGLQEVLWVMTCSFPWWFRHNSSMTNGELCVLWSRAVSYL